MRGFQNKFFLLFSIILNFSWAQIEPTMVSEAELKVLGTLPHKKDSLQAPIKKGEWRLDGIMFTSHSEWTVWLNGESFTPTHGPTGIRIVQVCNESVHLCPEAEEGPIKILHLNDCVRFHA